MTFDASLIAVLVAALVAGLVRGFSGFGAALVFMPVAAAAIDPKLAAAAFLIMDNFLALPLIVKAAPRCGWRTVLPAAIGAIVTVPIGAAILASADPVVLRWCLSALVLVLLGLLASGLRYSGEPHPAASVAVGGTAGVLSGIGQVSGPPMIAFWVAGPHPPAIIRANMIMFFAIVSISAIVAYAWNGFFTERWSARSSSSHRSTRSPCSPARACSAGRPSATTAASPTRLSRWRRSPAYRRWTGS